MQQENWKVYCQNNNQKPHQLLVSDLGNVKIHFLRTGKERYKKQTFNEFGYLKIHANVGNGFKTVSVHRLVAQLFCEKPENGEKLEVNHINGIKTDNRAVNLEWITHQENIVHMHKLRKSQHLEGPMHGMKFWNNGVKCVRAQSCPPGFVPGMLKFCRTY